MSDSAVVVTLGVNKGGLIEWFVLFENSWLAVVVGRENVGKGILHLNLPVKGRVKTFSRVKTAVF